MLTCGIHLQHCLTSSKNNNCLVKGSYEIFKLFQFRNQYIEAESGAYGSVQADGTVNGLVGMVARNEVDAAIQGLGIFATRAQWAQPLVPTGTYELQANLLLTIEHTHLYTYP